MRRMFLKLFDVRKGERLPAFFMALYLMFVLCAYYVLKPVSRALFLDRFEIESLPWLYVLNAVAGGFLAWAYTRYAVRTSLKHAVRGAMTVAAICLAGFWAVIPEAGSPAADRWYGQALLYGFNIWVSLFSVVLVSQGWLAAANLFDPRQAKRLYGLLGLGAILGASLGGSFTGLAAGVFGTRHLLLASAAVVALAYVAFALAARSGRGLAAARAAESESDRFSFREIPLAICRHRHLQTIVAIMTLAFIVDVMLEFQFSAMAQRTFRGDELTAFLGSFYGLYLGALTIVLQFFLTGLVVKRAGVGGMLQIMPVLMAAASSLIAVWPSLGAAAGARLAEGATRYSLNRTGMELLYLPLPSELRNRTKAFVDIFVDRAARGLGGLLLALFTSALALDIRQIAVFTALLSLAWLGLSALAHREYVRSVRKRLRLRQADVVSARTIVQDPGVIAELEQAAASGSVRQARYSLGILAEARGYDLAPLLRKLAASPESEVRGLVYDLARANQFRGLLDSALVELRCPASGATRPAVAYALAVSPHGAALATELLEHSNPAVAETALESMGPESARTLISSDWLRQAAGDPDPKRRALAALAIGVRGDHGTGALFELLADEDEAVVAAACRAAAKLQNPDYIAPMLPRLANARLRTTVIESLASYGPGACGPLGAALRDIMGPSAIRRHIPRVLRRIPEQRSVNILLSRIGDRDLEVRFAVLKALNKLKDEAPSLDFGGAELKKQILEEAREYFELDAALVPLRRRMASRSATALLARTIESRLRQTLERLFRLLGLRYPPKQIYAVYLAVNGAHTQEFAAALEFLESVLDRDLRRALMPLLDGAAQNSGFDTGLPGADEVIRDLILSRDPWIAACAMAAAAELGIRHLRLEIQHAARHGKGEVGRVAGAAALALAVEG